MRTARKQLSSVVAAGLHKVGKDVSKQLRAFGKAKKKDPADDIDLDGLSVLIDPSEKVIREVAQDSANRMLSQFGFDDEDMFNAVNEDAADYAMARSAEMVGKRYNDDGDLVDSNNAEYAIDDATRDMLRETIANGLNAGDSWEEIADEIADTYAFSDERAEMIARTEVTRANNQAQLISAKEATANGVNLKKGWLASEDACPICQDNEAEGMIDLDDEFPSGDDAAPAHPNCECTLVYERDDSEDGEDDEE